MCVICCNELRDDAATYTLECGHSYHTKCIVAWFRTNHNTCCLCRDVGEELRPVDMANRAKEIIRFAKHHSVSRRLSNKIKKYHQIKTQVKEHKTWKQNFENTHAHLFSTWARYQRKICKLRHKIDDLKERLVPLAVQVLNIDHAVSPRIPSGSAATVRRDIVSLARKYMRRQPQLCGSSTVYNILHGRVRSLLRKIKLNKKKLATARKSSRAFMDGETRNVFVAFRKAIRRGDQLEERMEKHQRLLAIVVDNTIPPIPLLGTVSAAP